MAEIVEGKGISKSKSSEEQLAIKRLRKATQNHNARANARGNGVHSTSKDPVRNPRGFRGSHIVSSSPLMEARRTHEATVEVTKQTSRIAGMAKVAEAQRLHLEA